MNDTLRWSAMDEHQHDALIAEKIFGYTVAQPWGPDGPYAITKDSSPEPESSWRDCPHYTTDMNAAWQVVERFGAAEVRKWPNVRRYEEKQYSCSIATHGQTFSEWGKTPAEAICLAALRAVGVDIE